MVHEEEGHGGPRAKGFVADVQWAKAKGFVPAEVGADETEEMPDEVISDEEGCLEGLGRADGY